MTFQPKFASIKDGRGNNMSKIKTLVPETVNEFDEIDFEEPVTA